MSTCRTLAYLECPTDGKVLAKSGICPQCAKQLYQFKPLPEVLPLNGRRIRANNKCRGVNRL